MSIGSDRSIEPVIDRALTFPWRQATQAACSSVPGSILLGASCRTLASCLARTHAPGPLAEEGG